MELMVRDVNQLDVITCEDVCESFTSKTIRFGLDLYKTLYTTHIPEGEDGK